MDVQVNVPENVDAAALKRYVAGVYSFARQMFPSISNDIIHRNYNEFAYWYESHLTCSDSCISIDLCPELMNTGGFTPTGELEPNGQLRIGMAACVFNKNGAKPKVWKKKFTVIAGGK